ncbi:hypothetical protein MKY95_18795 [Paenibacillus sp. FSL P4-0176]|uniref:hypothetical protein n=1 Tax=Paenibacillus sp. FSL P4-0176 TaxID=2921631 RepID=UPI0030CDC84E
MENIDNKSFQLKMKIGGLKEVIATEAKLLAIDKSDLETIKKLGKKLDESQDELIRHLKTL